MWLKPAGKTLQESLWNVKIWHQDRNRSNFNLNMQTYVICLPETFIIAVLSFDDSLQFVPHFEDKNGTNDTRNIMYVSLKWLVKLPAGSWL